jgi:phospholipase C
MTVSFRPTLPGIVTATVIVHGRQPQVDDGSHNGPPAVIPFVRFTIGATLEVLTPGSTTPVAGSAVKTVITSPEMGTRLVVTATASASAADLAGDWTARITNTADGAAGPPLGPARYDVTVRYQDQDGNLGKVDHIVVLMMENRSFDHLLGYLSLPGDGGRDDIEGLTGQEFNRDSAGLKHSVVLRTPPDVPPAPGGRVYPATAFLNDPEHGLDEVAKQLAGDGELKSNAGFVKNFAEKLDRDAVHLPPLIHDERRSDTIASEDVLDIPFRPARPGPLTVATQCTGNPVSSETGQLASLGLYQPGASQPTAFVRTPLGKPSLSVHVEVSQDELDAASGAWTARISNATGQDLLFTTSLTYVEQDHDRRWQERPEAVMSYYHAEHVPVYDLLSRHFTVCDHWFASMATDTWPNRLFALAGGSDGLTTTPSGPDVIDNPPGYTLETIFEILHDNGIEWSYNFSDAPFALVFQLLAQEAAFTSRMRPLDEFYDRCATGELAPVTWIDPNFTDIPDDPDRASDDHPPGDIARGQALVGRIYSHLTASPAWPKTLFIIVYDEHGGFYDHYTPEPAVDDPTTTYGPRVPAFLVTPYVPPGSVSKTTYDHTSLLATILRRFCRQVDGQLPYMSARVELANDMGSALVANPTTFDAPAAPSPTAGVFVPTPPTDRMSFGTVLHTALFGF